MKIFNAQMEISVSTAHPLHSLKNEYVFVLDIFPKKR